MVIVNIENGERHQVKLDIYQKKSIVRPTMHGGTVWVDGEEYVYEEDYEITWLNLKRKFEEMTSSENYNMGNFYNKKVKWPSQEYKSPFEDMVWIANYKTEGFQIRLTLFGEKCIFSTGTYLDEESAEQWLNMEEKEAESE